MSKENIELLRRLEAAWNAGEQPNVQDYFDPEVEFVPLRSATEGGYRGLAGIEAFTEDTWQVFEKFELHHEYRELDERVLVWGHNHVRTRGSGLEMDIEIGGLMDFRNGKIVRWEDFGSKEKALEAAAAAERD
jgi:ketosteroid isomerase-like protein